MATVTSWVEHLSADEVAGAVYPFIGTEWLWLTIAVVFWLWFMLRQEQEKLKNSKSWLEKDPEQTTIRKTLPNGNLKY